MSFEKEAKEILQYKIFKISLIPVAIIIAIILWQKTRIRELYRRTRGV